MSDRYVEKTFLFLLVLSLLVHIGVGVLLYYLPRSIPRQKSRCLLICRKHPI